MRALAMELCTNKEDNTSEDAFSTAMYHATKVRKSD